MLYALRKSPSGSTATINNVFMNSTIYFKEEIRLEEAGMTSGPRSRLRLMPSTRCSTSSTCTRTRAMT
eukprot:9078754-Pyramimonas_sp.AAC.1